MSLPQVEDNQGLDYFFKNEKLFADKFVLKSLQAFRDAGKLFEEDSLGNVDKWSRQTQDRFEKKMGKIENLFKSYCVKKGQNRMQAIIRRKTAEYFYGKNLVKRMFNAYKSHYKYKDYLRKKTDQAEIYLRCRTAKLVIKKWNEVVMNETRVSIKNTCLKKTDLEIAKMQKDYEGIIKNLENALEKKILELKKEEEEHRLLAEKYDTMVQKKKVDQQFM